MQTKGNTAERSLVLILDDDESIRASTQRLIRSFGFKAEVIASARDLLKSLRATETVGCLLLDVHMPGMDGLELQRRLNKTHPELAIIFMTGCASNEEISRANAAGAVALLLKPVKPEALIHAIRRALKQTGRAE